MGKRKNGEGHYGTKIFKGIPYKYYRDIDGNFTYAKTPKELNEKLKKKRSKDIVVKNTKSDLYTFGELCDQWLQINYIKISPGTYDDYEAILKCRVTNYKSYDIANKQNKSLSEDIFNKYFISLTKHYSRSSIIKTWAILKQIIQYGMDENYFTIKVNKITMPKEEHVLIKKKEISFITFPDIEFLYKETSRKYSTGTLVYGDAAKIIIFIMYSGLRLGEVLALKWKYVASDFSNITVYHSIRKIIERDENNKAFKNENGTNKYKLLLKQPKTKDGERIVPLPDRAIEVLKYFYNTKRCNENDFVFTTSKGTIYEKENIERTLRGLLKKSECECKSYTPHSLRHGYGSILISKGADIKLVSELLGHSDVRFTYDVYIGILKEDKIKIVNDVFNKKDNDEEVIRPSCVYF